MLQQLKLANGRNPFEITYDGLGLRIEGPVHAVQKASKRSVSELTLMPVAKVNVLYIAYENNELLISTLIPRDHVKADASLDLVEFHVPVEEAKVIEAQKFASMVLNHVYEGRKAQKRLKVLVNPKSGKGLARKMLNETVAPIFDSARCVIDIQETESAGHAVRIAKELDIEAYDGIVTVSGDGIIHEVLNGLCARPDAGAALKKVPIGLIPGGTGNSLSLCLLGDKPGFDPAHTTRQIIKGKPLAIDLCSVTYRDHRYMSFLSQNYGITSYADLATEPLRWMGDTRTILGLLQQVITGQSYTIEAHVQIAEANKEKIKSSFPAEAQLPGEPFFEDGAVIDTIPALDKPVPSDWTEIKGDISIFLTSKVPSLTRGMMSHPCAVPNDGMIDLMLVRNKQNMLSKLAMFGKFENGDHIDSDAVEYYKVKAFRLKPIAKPGKKVYVAIDGEHAPAEEFQVQVHPGLAYVYALYPGYESMRSWRPTSSVATAGTNGSSGSFKRKLRAFKSKVVRTFAYVLSLIRSFFCCCCGSNREYQRTSSQ